MKKILRKFIAWLKSHKLVWCLNCHKLIFYKDARHEFTTSGLVAILCRKCHNELYHPFTGEPR